MRILVTHDVQGNIQHVVITSADAPFARVTPETGPSVTSEVEISEVTSGLDLSNLEGNPRRLIELTRQLQDFRIEAGTKARIIRK